MKAATLYLCFLGLLTFQANSADTPAALPDSQTSLESFKAEMESQFKFNAYVSNFCGRAFASRRLDLVEACFIPALIYPFCATLRNEPESKFKDQVVLMMLRGPSETWQDFTADQGADFSANHQQNVATLMLPSLRRYLPPDQLSIERFYSKKARLELADQFKKALA